MEINVSIKGTAPLLMHRFVMEDDASPKKRQKIYIPEEEAEKAAYRNEDGKLFLPSIHIKAAMIAAGVDFIYSGRKTYKQYIKSGLFIKDTENILTPQEYIVDNQPVVVSRSRIIRSRPRLDDWECSFTIEVVNEDLNPTILKEILENAGKFYGVGDFRPEYGRFKITSFESQK